MINHTKYTWRLTMKIEKYGESRRCELVSESLSRMDLRHAGIERIILLPIPTSRDGIYLTGTDTLISDVLMKLECGDGVVGYGISDEDAEIIRASGGVLVDVSRDEIFLLENARLTAYGTLGYILTEIKRAPTELSFGVVGYGRIGKELTALLISLGASVVVYTSKNATRVALGACGIRTEPYENVEKWQELADVLINTAPHSLTFAFRDGKVPCGKTVIELASGKNFEGILGVTGLPSLAERCYPNSAADAYLRAILRGLGVRI